MEQSTPKKKKGFATMSSDVRQRIASMGGKAAHQQGTAHQWDSSEARSAGKKGGEAVSKNRDHMSEIGRKGGKAKK
jgi:general stress protein YciG